MWQFDIRNIGGIREGETSLERGINTVQADNWQGKSSFIKTVQTAIGATGIDGTEHPLTEGATEGEITFDTADETYVTTLHREGRTVTRSDDVYLTDREDQMCAYLFAVLGEDNPVRAAIRNDGDLADLLGRPLDIENIDEKIATLTEKRDRVASELDAAERAAEQLPGVQEDVTQLERELEELREELEEVRSETAGRSDRSTLRDELSDFRATRNQLTGAIERIENKIDRKRSRLEQKRRELEELSEPDESETKTDLDEKQSRIADLRTQIEILDDIHSANRRVLDENQFHLVADVDRSIAGDDVTCWTCGTATGVDDFEEQVAALQDRIGELRSERADLESEIAEIEQERTARERQRRKRRDLETEISDLETGIEESRRELSDRKDRLADVESKIEDLDETVEATDDRLTDLQSEIKLKESELERKRSKRAELEARDSDRSTLEQRADELRDEIVELRNRKKNKQREVAEQFEDAMTDIIDRFEPGFENARLEPRTDAADEIVDYELIVARDGREASLDALSEGEVELVGLVTALAGYKTFDVDERVPAILLDDVGSLSGQRIESLVEYLNDEAPYVVTTAYPEAGDFRGHTVSPNEWDVVSDRQATSS